MAIDVHIDEVDVSARQITVTANDEWSVTLDLLIDEDGTLRPLAEQRQHIAYTLYGEWVRRRGKGNTTDAAVAALKAQFEGQTVDMTQDFQGIKQMSSRLPLTQEVA